MKIRDDHLYHGAALIQIAEHDQFTAINSLKIGKKVSRVAYKINDDIAVYFKYASQPKKPYSEYVFTFNQEHLDDLTKIDRASGKTFIALVCVKDREICCFNYSKLSEMAQARATRAKQKEPSLNVMVTVPKGKSLRVYVNAPGERGISLGESIISRSLFPNVIFE